MDLDDELGDCGAAEAARRRHSDGEAAEDEEEQEEEEMNEDAIYQSIDAAQKRMNGEGVSSPHLPRLVSLDLMCMADHSRHGSNQRSVSRKIHVSREAHVSRLSDTPCI